MEEIITTYEERLAHLEKNFPKSWKDIVEATRFHTEIRLIKQFLEQLNKLQ